MLASLCNITLDVFVRQRHGQPIAQFLRGGVNRRRVGELREHHQSDGKHRTVAKDNAVNHVEHAVDPFPDLSATGGTWEVSLAGCNSVAHGFLRLGQWTIRVL